MVQNIGLNRTALALVNVFLLGAYSQHAAKVCGSDQDWISACNDHSRLPFFFELIIHVIEAYKDRDFAVANDQDNRV